MGFEIFKPTQGRRALGVLFDMDGLVLDSEILYTRFWIEATELMGHKLSLEQALGMRSLSHDRGQKYLDSCFGEGKINFHEARNLRIKLMDAWIDEHGVAPKKGIYELLDYLDAEKIPRAMTTSSPQERVKAHLSPLGLYERFPLICTGYEVKHGKPDPDIYLYGAETLKLPPENCIALEDSPAGIESAFRAGCMAVLVPDEDAGSPETRSMCFALADSLSDVCGIIDTLNK